ncbi:MAG: efflux transporter periplasmic adaptor subunit [Thermodesulfovibrio sp.]|nr:efflux transporter periplasmic adaptor subunit [Thermodesulfovibrio sp.]
MQATTRRRIFIITVVTAVILAVIYGFLPKPVPVDVAQASRAAMTVTIEEEGKTRVSDRFVISSPVSGSLRRIVLKVGDIVKKGQQVAVIEPVQSSALDPRSRAMAEAAATVAQSAIKTAEEQERAAEAATVYARKNFERQRELHAAGYIARDVFEQAEADSKKAAANHLAAVAGVKTARLEHSRTLAALGNSAADRAVDRRRIAIVSSPVEGRVLKLQRESEAVVNAGDPLLDIGDPGQIEVKIEVLSADAVSIKPGTTVLFERWGGNTPLAGIVRNVEPAAFTKVSSLGVEEQRVLVIADITSVPEEMQRLGDGYRVEAKFVIWEQKDVLQVPVSALFRKGDGWAIFLNEAGRARLKQVTIGHRNGAAAEVLKGIAEGEKVITHPDDTVRDGVRVRLRQRK